MQKRIVRKDEQIRLIMECRQSGLSGYQWCQRQDINVGTFYNWVSKLRKAGYTFPDSKSKSKGAVVVQDVVKINLVSEDKTQAGAHRIYRNYLWMPSVQRYRGTSVYQGQWQTAFY